MQRDSLKGYIPPMSLVSRLLSELTAWLMPPTPSAKVSHVGGTARFESTPYSVRRISSPGRQSLSQSFAESPVQNVYLRHDPGTVITSGSVINMSPSVPE